MRGAVLLAAVLLAGCTGMPHAADWRFDNLQRIGGVVAHPEGAPQVIETAAGPAIRFDGVKDALFIDQHPLAGAATFTAEAIFRPEGGPFEQRWLHLAEIDPKTGADTSTRFLFEIRVVGMQWYLDAFTTGPGYRTALMDPTKLHPLGPWYRVAMSYDGAMFRSYVNGVLQAEAPIAFRPQGPGHSAVGVRANKIDWFKGSIYQARFTPAALAPKDFLPLPEGLNPPGD